MHAQINQGHLPAHQVQQQQPQERPVEQIHHQYKRAPEVVQPRQVSPRLMPTQYTPPLQHEDDMMFSQGFDRDGSRTPPMFTYHTYPAPEDIVYPAYPHTQQYRPMPERQDSYGDYLAQIPVTLPSMMQFTDSVKREGEDTMSPFNMSYHAVAGIDIHAPTHGYDDSNPHVSRPRRI